MKNKKPLIIIGIIVLLILIIRTINGYRRENAEKIAGDYKTVYDVSGISFDVPTRPATNATAISEVSSKIDSAANNYYIYKDGGEHYLLFRMDSLVVAAQRGTKFSSATSIDEILDVGSICNIWFVKNGKEVELEKADGVSFINDVSGGFVATDELFDDYSGKISVISDGETEYSLFVGVRSAEKYKDLTDEQKNVIERVANSLNLHEVTETDEKVEQYEVTINGAQEDEVKTEEPKETAPTSVPTPKPTQAPPDESPQESEPGEIVSVEENDTVPEEKEVEEHPETEDSEEDEKPSPTDGVLTIRETSRVKVDSKAYSSDIYSMLSVEDNGIITEHIPVKDKDSTVIISVRRTFSGDAAINQIKDYCNRTKEYNYFEPEDGCHWEVMEYFLSYRDEETPYINIKIKGIDGQKLKFRGISYGKRTYDMNDRVKDGIFSGPYYCYYAVPNGCKEYVLECGTGNIDVKTGSMAAYYLISN